MRVRVRVWLDLEWCTGLTTFVGGLRGRLRRDNVGIGMLICPTRAYECLDAFSIASGDGLRVKCK